MARADAVSPLDYETMVDAGDPDHAEPPHPVLRGISLADDANHRAAMDRFDRHFNRG